MNEKEIILPEKKTKKKWLTKKLIFFIGNIFPSLVAITALLFAYSQTKEINDTNFQIKKFEITYNEKKKSYLDLITIINQIKETEFDATINKKEDFQHLYQELMNYAFALAIYLDTKNSLNLEVECRKFWEIKFNYSKLDEFEKSLAYFNYDLKDILFKN